MAASTNAEQIVIGQNDRWALTRAFIGSVSADLTRHCSVPVTVVPNTHGSDAGAEPLAAPKDEVPATDSKAGDGAMGKLASWFR